MIRELLWVLAYLAFIAVVVAVTCVMNQLL